ncbi:MAG: cryptochrome/photolyase family protein [Gemmatimonas sp.]
MTSPVILWFRFDLRIADNAAVDAAARSGRPVIPVYILDDDSPGEWRLGAASRWWLAGSLEALSASLARLGSRLVLRHGEAGRALASVIAETGATEVVCNRVHEPWAVARDERIAAALAARAITFRAFESQLLFPPEAMPGPRRVGYRVFTAFWKAALASPAPAAPIPVPTGFSAPDPWPASEPLGDWSLCPTAPDWAGGLRDAWTPGEEGARERLTHFLNQGIEAYATARDRPDLSGTSRLSPHLRFGEIGPRQVWHAVTARAAAENREAAGAPFLRQLLWREFSYNLLNRFPQLPEEPLQRGFGRFPWRGDEGALAAWRRGRTGYPMVDAAMRELWATGWMHNRARMIVASFLVKHLLQPWHTGAGWFWDTLVDADLANNAASWQWVAGCGADAAPYFRIFNPVLQGEKFDPDGAYVRRWVPELAGLPSALIHRPWTATPLALADAGVRLGHTYPRPIVDHAFARSRALAALASIKNGR